MMVIAASPGGRRDDGSGTAADAFSTIIHEAPDARISTPE